MVGSEEVGLLVVFESRLELPGSFESKTEMIMRGREIWIETNSLLKRRDAFSNRFGIASEDGTTVEVGDGDFRVESDGSSVFGEGVGDLLLSLKSKSEVEVDQR